MSTATKTKPSFKVPSAGAASPAPTKPEPAKSTGPKLERPFKPGDLHGFSDDDLRTVLRFSDFIDPKQACYPRDISDLTAFSEEEALDLFKGTAPDGYPIISDVRGRGQYHQMTFGNSILEWIERCHIQPHFSEFILGMYRRKHPQLFAEQVEPNLIMRMRTDKAKIEAEKREAERQKAAAILNKKWGRVAEIMGRYLIPTDQDVAEMIDLSDELLLGEAGLDRLWRWLQSVYRRQQRVAAAHAKGARFDPKNEDITRLRKSAAAMPAFFETSSEYPYPRLKFPPVITD